MPVTLRPPTLAECELVRRWRNDPAVLPGLRTGYKTAADQAAFYRSVICDPQADHRYYALVHADTFIGLGGLTYLSRVQGEAEISMILDPSQRGKGLGSAAVDALLDEAWRLGLTSVIGECYAQGNVGFWSKQLARRPGRLTWQWAKPQREMAVLNVRSRETR